MLRFTQMKLRQAANDVMLRINDVALRANTTLVFTPFNIAPFPQPYGLERATLSKFIEEIVFL